LSPIPFGNGYQISLSLKNRLLSKQLDYWRGSVEVGTSLAYFGCSQSGRTTFFTIGGTVCGNTRPMTLRTHGLKTSGFTVVEMLLTIGIASIILAIAIPALLSTLPRLRLSSAARQVASDLQVARIKAISQNTANTVTFNTSTTYTFSIGSDSRDFGQLYPGITFAVSANPVFTARGTASAAVIITLSNGTAQKLVCVKTVGRVNIADSSCA